MKDSFLGKDYAVIPFVLNMKEIEEKNKIKGKFFIQRYFEKRPLFRSGFEAVWNNPTGSKKTIGEQIKRPELLLSMVFLPNATQKLLKYDVEQKI